MSIEGWELELVGMEEWDLMHMNWERIHRMRGKLPPDEVIGYEYRSERHHVYFFVCAYHETPDYFKKWTKVTVKDTQDSYYQCDRMGCEMSYHQEWMQEEENDEGEEE